MSPDSILTKYWGHTSFRPPQEEIIQSVLGGKDVVAILPTGGGKSVCFQVPALAMEGLCVVITPLIALMQDQVEQLKQKGIAAVAIHSGLSHQAIDILLDNCIYGQQQFLYLSPERLQTELFQARFKKMNVNLIAVDEAHCISQWGYDFRPPYLRIAELREVKPNVPIIALTASATRVVKEDIIAKLQLKSPAVFQISFARENISLVVRETETKEKKLLEILRKVSGSAIVYVRSRKATQEIARLLQRNKISAAFYHAGLSHQDRTSRQHEWLADRCRVMVATNAFGMGIDKSNVRLVIHLDIPEDIESYYQEAGRGGRDGKKAYATLIFHEADVQSLRHKVEQSQPQVEYLQKVYQALANHFQLAMGSSEGESYDFDLDQFCRKFSLKSAAVYPALKKLEEAGLVTFNESFYRPSRVHFSIDKKKIYEFQVAHARFDSILKALLRLYGGELYADFMTISEAQLSSALKLSVPQVKGELQQLHELQLLAYEPSIDNARITFVLPRQDAERLPIDRMVLEARRNLHLRKMESIIQYAEQSQRCRMQLIQEYFDEITYNTCGICDVCIEKRKQLNSTTTKDYETQIIYLLTNHAMSPEELEQQVAPKEKDLFVEVLREAVDAGQVYYDENWLLHLKDSKK
ncbi:MAG: RecQ family ATP-dependent DNA helicase [Cytophagales bacterium]|nr:RecQ family ATP-dependent DNA helicase [Cytophagales bacterium]MCA6366194.1 RecQ family ATP-dependent DNA helicase [Cytophagales bacterium]MCA6369864.1 RecQ family ATP-dependent DNA helicase [Cytophagales bacterium]MCA6374552.1 RecQ family ATP-dependent DNA helicase [Cytophagales bacterium]MCA6384812.1 RecQ family ATP-dependent DNA helicase [Cytophagales bacterium]